MTPCEWPTLGCDTCCDLDIPPDVADAAAASAKQWLWEATKRRFGNCAVTIRPCLYGCNSFSGAPWMPFRDAGGGWVNVSCGRCGDTCSCRTVPEVVLPTPGEVLTVELDGVALVEGVDWRVDNRRRLVRLDGAAWPRCQDMLADPPTWAVTYTPGLPVPEMGQLAAGQLSCQLARRACGQKCDIPANAVTVNRQGVTILIEPGEKTGLWMVDNWIEMMNRPMARIWSPDLPVVRTVAASESPGSP